MPMDARTRNQSPRLLFDLRTERLNRGYSQKGLADEIGVSREAIRKLENGTGSVYPHTAKILADYFGITVVDLLSEDAA